MSTITALIVDDEPHARRFLRSLLEKESDFHILDECKNGREVINFCKTQTPDIIFLDIQMPGMDGLEVAYQLRGNGSIVIFCTAFDQFAIQAFEVEALDYLIKPYSEKRFDEVLKRAKNLVDLNQRKVFSERVERMFNSYKKASSPSLEEIVIPNKGLEDRIPVSRIQLIEASSVYAILHTKNRQFIYRASLDMLARQLPKSFIRIHRSYIINSSHISNTKYLSNNTFSFTLSSGKMVKSSRSYKHDIASFLSTTNHS